MMTFTFILGSLVLLLLVLLAHLILQWHALNGEYIKMRQHYEDEVRAHLETRQRLYDLDDEAKEKAAAPSWILGNDSVKDSS